MVWKSFLLSGSFQYFVFSFSLCARLCRTMSWNLAYGQNMQTTCGTAELPPLSSNLGQKFGGLSGLWATKTSPAWTSEIEEPTEIVNVFQSVLIFKLTWICFCGSSQEGVDQGLYSPLEVSVETDKGLIVCRTYQINNFHACLPSPDYKLVREPWFINKTPNSMLLWLKYY